MLFSPLGNIQKVRNVERGGWGLAVFVTKRYGHSGGGWLSRPVRYVTAKKIFTVLHYFDSYEDIGIPVFEGNSNLGDEEDDQ